jgi:DNA-binding LytR/AlgR family response regulator
MKVEIKQITRQQPENAVIEVHRVTEQIKNVQRILENTLAEYFLLYDPQTDQELKIGTDEIAYIEYLNRKLFFYANNAAVYEKQSSLKDALPTLPAKFVRCSRTLVVNIDALLAIAVQFNGNVVATLNNGEKIEVSRRYVQFIKAALKEEAYS